MEKLTIDVEDEAKFALKHALKNMGITMEVTSPTLPDLELNLLLRQKLSYVVSGRS